MTEKRYCDGTLAKWYYSRTNVISDGDDEYHLNSKKSIKDWEYNELLGTNDLLDELNRLSGENEQLKQELKTKCIVNKQYEENQRLIKMLDNVANYMQKQHKDMPIDDFVEWWNNIATEGL